MADGKFRIIACDGGGMLGLIPAMLVQDLEKDCGITSQTDLFAGTSAGGAVSVGLAGEVPVGNLVDMFLQHGNEIFLPYDWFSEDLSDVGRIIERIIDNALGGLLDSHGVMAPLYTDQGLKKLVRQNLMEAGHSADVTLAEFTRKIMVTTFQLYGHAENAEPVGNWSGRFHAWRPTLFSNFEKSDQFSFISGVQAAASTTAAPIFFPPQSNGDLGYFADGGLFANNPSVKAIATALRAGIPLEEIRLLSLGTGFLPYNISEETIGNPYRWGLLNWAWPKQREMTPPFAVLVSILMGPQMEAGHDAHYILGTSHFRRGNPTLPEPYAIDDWKNIDQVQEWTNEYIQRPVWQEIKEWVHKEFL